MKKMLKPGQNVGKNGGIYKNISKTGKPLGAYATVPDNKILPPTKKKGSHWEKVKITPHNIRNKN